MAYTVPKVEITQTFVQSPAVTTQPLSAFIIGPQFDLHRYDVPAEKAGISVGDYVSNANTVYNYPSQTAGTIVDTSYVQVNIDDAAGLYFPNATLGSVAGTNNVVELVETTATSGKYYPNRLHFTTGSGTVLKTGNGFSRSDYFSNRDVQVGDVITVTDNLGNTLTTQINAVIADTSVQDASLDPTIGAKLVTGTDGVANGTTTFTSASGTFTGLAGQTITITGKGTYQILSVNSAHSVNLNAVVASGSSIHYYVGGVYNDIGNIELQSQVISNVPTYAWTGAGSDPTAADITIDTSDTTAYVGYPAARIANDTYVVTVTTSGSLTTARFSVASTAGAFATQTGLALASNLLTLDSNAGNTVIWDFTGSTGSPVFTAGQQWSVALSAAVVLVNPTTSGTFTGAANTTYKLTVTKGGPAYTGTNAATAAQITVTSDNVDSSPATLVGSAAFPVGSLGVLATFSGGSQNSQFVLGDSYYIVATAASQGAYKIVQFNDALPTATLTLSGANPITATLALVQSTFDVPPIASVEDDTLNWVATTDSLTLNAAVATTDPNIVYGGTPVSLPVQSGTVYIQHRDLNLTNATSIGSASLTVPAALGVVHPDNPLAQGVSAAITNAAGQQVYFIGLQTNDLAGYNTALSISKTNKSVYSTVPLTYDSATQEAVVGFINGVSTPQVAKWRIAWLAGQVLPTALLYNLKPDNSNWTGTVTADPLASGTVYSLVTVAGATFLTSGIRPGDSVLINFTTDPLGNVIYNTYTVAEVRTQTTLVLTAGLNAAINSPIKVQIQRNYSADEQVTNLAAVAAGYDNRRVRLVFPDDVVSSGQSMPGYFLAAALAGLRSGVAPHQGLTNTPVLGFDTLPEIDSTFTSDQLDVLASSGVFIVTQTVAGAVPYVRHQLTTNVSSILYQEDSITTNVDAISYALQDVLTPFIGIYNRNNYTLQLIKDALLAEINYLQTQTFTQTAGYQLGPNTAIVSLAFDLTFADTINVVINLDVPGPTNYITVNLVV